MVSSVFLSSIYDRGCYTFCNTLVFGLERVHGWSIVYWRSDYTFHPHWFGDGSPEVGATALLVYVLYPLLMPLTKLRCTLEKHFLDWWYRPTDEAMAGFRALLRLMGHENRRHWVNDLYVFKCIQKKGYKSLFLFPVFQQTDGQEHKEAPQPLNGC